MKPKTGRKRLQMLPDLTKGDGYFALKQADKERKGQRQWYRNQLYSRRLKKNTLFRTEPP